MDLLGLTVDKAVLFALMTSRIAGFVVVSPFPGNEVDTRQRVGLVAVLAWIASTFASMPPSATEIGIRLIGSAMLEVGCGIVLGLAFRFVFVAAEVLGAMLAQGTGLSSPSVLNPTLEAHDTVLSRIVTLLAMLLALAAGTHRVALAYLLESFRSLPVGLSLDFAATAGSFVDWTGEAFAVGLRLAMPVVAVGLIVQIALAMIARAAPSLQIFSVGLTVLLASGFITILASFDSIGSGLLEHLGTLAPRLDRVLEALSGARP